MLYNGFITKGPLPTKMKLTGFEYFSLVFFIFLAQYYKDSKVPVVPIFTFGFGMLTVVFMIIGK
jgi:hypothetical protein